MKDLMKSLFYLVLIVLVIGVAIYFVDNYSGGSKGNVANANTVTNNNVNNKSNNTGNTENKKNTGNTVKEDDKKDDNKDKKDEENKENKENEDNKKQTEVAPVTGEKKAIELAKKEYGDTDGVYFNCEKTQSNNEYIVCVRDAETTRALAWYTIDVVNETVK